MISLPKIVEYTSKIAQEGGADRIYPSLEGLTQHDWTDLVRDFAHRNDRKGLPLSFSNFWRESPSYFFGDLMDYRSNGWQGPSDGTKYNVYNAVLECFDEAYKAREQQLDSIWYNKALWELFGDVFSLTMRDDKYDTCAHSYFMEKSGRIVRLFDVLQPDFDDRSDPYIELLSLVKGWELKKDLAFWEEQLKITKGRYNIVFGALVDWFPHDSVRLLPQVDFSKINACYLQIPIEELAEKALQDERLMKELTSATAALPPDISSLVRSSIARSSKK